MLAHLFLSHSSADDGVVVELREALADLGLEVWIDSRQFKGGDPLWSEITAAIEGAMGMAVLVSPAALQSEWVFKELQHALRVRAERGQAAYPVILLSLDGAKPGRLEELFSEAPTCIPVSSGAPGATDAIRSLLVALGRRLPNDPRGALLPPRGPWRVFLSHASALKQLPERGPSYVAAAERAVVAAGHTIVQLGEFEKDAQSPAKAIERLLRGCDVHVGLIGQRYGATAPDRLVPSDPELEFDTATALGLPRLMFLLDDDAAADGMRDEVFVDKALEERHAAFRQRLLDSGITVQLFRTSQQLGLLVERSLRELEERARKNFLIQRSPAAGEAHPERRHVFVGYSRVDRAWVDRLQPMMKPLLHEGGPNLTLWDESQILPGTAWRTAIETALAETKVALLLVSDAFLASEFVMNEEVPKLLMGAGAEGLRVLWVSVSPSSVEGTELYHYQAVWPPDQPLETLALPRQMEALKTIVLAIREALLEPSPTVSAPPRPAPPSAESAILWTVRCRLWREPLADGVVLPMVWIPADPGGQPGECLLGSEPVTLRQWQVVAGWPPQAEELEPKPEPTVHGDPDQPVSGISHGQAVEFCRRLAARTGRYYELPTEQDWEHACRAGGTTPYSWGVAWSPILAADVANPWGLWRMHGGLWEWCRGGGLRGGSWADPVERRQARSRAEASETWAPLTVGMRVCCLPFGTPFQRLEASRAQWRPPLTRTACEQVLGQPLSEERFENLQRGLRRFRIRATRPLRLFLALLADYLGAGAVDSRHPLRLSDPEAEDRFARGLADLSIAGEEAVGTAGDQFSAAAFLWKDRALRERAEQAASAEAFWTALGLPKGERQDSFLRAWTRAVNAFPGGG
jgi:hypothetical protein